jgi:hypothetical protein
MFIENTVITLYTNFLLMKILLNFYAYILLLVSIGDQIYMNWIQIHVVDEDQYCKLYGWVL